MIPHADRRVTAEMWLASVSLSPWHDRTQVELREARAYDGKRVNDNILRFETLTW